MTMYNDIVWGEVGNTETRIMNSVTVANYTGSSETKALFPVARCKATAGTLPDDTPAAKRYKVTSQTTPAQLLVPVVANVFGSSETSEVPASVLPSTGAVFYISLG